MSKPKHNCNDCIKEDVCEWAVYYDDIICDSFVDKLILKRLQDNLINLVSFSELCNEYCRNCILIYKSAGCADCICAHVREIIEGNKVGDNND